MKKTHLYTLAALLLAAFSFMAFEKALSASEQQQADIEEMVVENVNEFIAEKEAECKELALQAAMMEADSIFAADKSVASKTRKATKPKPRPKPTTTTSTTTTTTTSTTTYTPPPAPTKPTKPTLGKGSANTNTTTTVPKPTLGKGDANTNTTTNTTINTTKPAGTGVPGKPRLGKGKARGGGK